MKKFNELVEEIVNELKITALNVEKEIMKRLPEDFSYDFLTGHPRYLLHDLDPRWDSSGQLFSRLSEPQFELDHYKKVGDFFEEYTGNSTASYLSGGGLFHETYGDQYEEWMTELFRNAHSAVLERQGFEVLMTLASEVFDDDYIGLVEIDDLAQELVNGIVEFEDHSYCYAENLCLKISEMDFLFVYKLGEKKAKEQIRKETVAMENRKNEIEIEKSTFDKLWSLLEKKYRLAYQKSFPNRIELAEFESFEKFLDEQKVQKQERILIGKYAPISFSDSVTFKLTMDE